MRVQPLSPPTSGRGGALSLRVRAQLAVGRFLGSVTGGPERLHARPRPGPSCTANPPETGAPDPRAQEVGLERTAGRKHNPFTIPFLPPKGLPQTSLPQRSPPETPPTQSTHPILSESLVPRGSLPWSREHICSLPD